MVERGGRRHRRHGHHGAHGEPVEVARGQVEHDVAPREGQGDEEEAEGEDEEGVGQVLILHLEEEVRHDAHHRVAPEDQVAGEEEEEDREVDQHTSHQGSQGEAYEGGQEQAGVVLAGTQRAAVGTFRRVVFYEDFLQLHYVH